MEYECTCDFSKPMTMPELGQAITCTAWNYDLGMACFIGNGHLWLDPGIGRPGTLAGRKMTPQEVEEYKTVSALVVKYNGIVDDFDVLSK